MPSPLFWPRCWSRRHGARGDRAASRYDSGLQKGLQKNERFLKKNAPRVFVNYRRKDSQSDAGRIFERLEVHYGRDRVFMDIDSIPLSIDFRDHINQQIGESDIVLVLIGQNWLRILREYQPGVLGRLMPRIREPDWVQLEIESALSQGKVIVPILLGRFPMPSPELLPKPLRQIAFLNGQTIDPGEDFNHHMDRLIRGLDALSIK
jgi:hypothetical protein